MSDWTEKPRQPQQEGEGEQHPEVEPGTVLRETFEALNRMQCCFPRFTPKEASEAQAILQTAVNGVSALVAGAMRRDVIEGKKSLQHGYLGIQMATDD